MGWSAFNPKRAYSVLTMAAPYQSGGNILIGQTVASSQIGGREIDGVAVIGQSQPDGQQRGAHPFATFGDGFIGQADNIESVLSGFQIHLHFNRCGFDALKGNGLDIGDNVFSFLDTSLRKNAYHHKQGLICVARQA